MTAAEADLPTCGPHPLLEAQVLEARGIEADGIDLVCPRFELAHPIGRATEALRHVRADTPVPAAG
jgi:hypothetical protein